MNPFLIAKRYAGYAVLLSIFLIFFLVRPATAQDIYHIVFVSNRDGNEEIYVMDSSGAQISNLTRSQARDWHPDWSPDGKQITFNTNRDGNNEIYLMQNNGRGAVNVTNNPAADNAPDWSPDGETIVFASDRDGVPDLYLLDITTQIVTRLTEDGADKGAPTWSPDSREVMYWANDGGVTQIFAIDVATHESRRLTEDGPDNWPAWSPDGTQFIYENATAGTADIFISNLDGTQIQNLTNSAGNDVRPAWSADGSQIIFASDREGSLSIYVMDADGSNLRLLTTITGDNQSPMWQPIPAPIETSEASLDLSFTQLSPGGIASTVQEEFGDGRVRLYAPLQANVDALIHIRLEVTLDAAVLPTPTPVLGTPMPTPTPLDLQGEAFTTVFRVMGAELGGVDLDLFTTSPRETDYVLRLDPNAVNYWEWTLRAAPEALGKRYLSVNLYIPEVAEDGSIIKTVLNTVPMQIDLLPTNRPVDNGDTVLFAPVPAAVEPIFSILFADPNSFTIVTHSEQDISDVSIAIAGTDTEFPVAGLFRIIQEDAWSWGEGICLRYVREGTEPVLPLACTDELLERILSGVDVFWYDNRSNLLRDVIVRYQGRAVICSSAEQHCDIGDN
jgi:TolB protein